MMTHKKLLTAFAKSSAASGVPHSGEFFCAGGKATILLHCRISDAAKRKMRRAWASEDKLPPLSIKTHRFAYQPTEVN
jgi:hypothetical protein